MSGLKGGGTRTVQDFLFSVDYVFCHGPVDSINQVWVRERPILCGQYSQNFLETIYLPNRFGGDEAEGGVDGALEGYLGGDTQLASAALAARFGEVPAQWPGARGVCHLFFRGATSGLAGGVLNTGSDVLDGTLFSSDNGRGFRWGSNNPYHPNVAAHMTRLPNNLGLAQPSVPQIASISGAGLPVDANNGWQLASGLIDARAIYAWTVGDRWQDTSGYVGSGITTTVGGIEGILVGSGPASSQPYLTPVGDGDIYFWTNDGNLHQSSTAIKWDAGWVEAIAQPDGFGRYNTGITYHRELDIQDAWAHADIDAGTAVAVLTSNILIQSSSFAESAVCSGVVNFYVGPTVGGSKGTPVASVPFSHAFSVSLGAGILVQAAVKLPVGTRKFFIETVMSQMDPQLITSAGSFREYRVAHSASIDGDFATAPVYTYCQPNGDLTGFPDANPAEIIYEILTNTEWGKGEPPTNIDIASFQLAGQVLLNERMGMSFLWSRQETFNDMIQYILNHIDAALFINPKTGLYTLILARNDYVIGNLKTFDETNCKATKRRRRAWGDTVNEITVTYTDPNSETDATVQGFDDANIEIQDAIVPGTRDYSGFRNPFIAQFAADREARKDAYPIFSTVLEPNRDAWDVTPFEVLNFSWPDDGIVQMPLRVMRVDYGDPEDKQMKIEVIEDVYGLDLVGYSNVPITSWTPQDVDPTPFDYEFGMTVPMPLLQRRGLDATNDVDANFPDAGVLFSGAYLAGASPAIDFEAHTGVQQANGSVPIQSIGTFAPNLATELPASLVEEELSIIPGSVIAAISFGQGSAGDLYCINDQELYHEFIILDTYDSILDEWTVIRGVWDTPIEPWSLGTVIWNMEPATQRIDGTVRSAGEVRTYRYLPRTSRSRLNYGAAADVVVNVNERAFRPFRPANTELDGNGFATTNAGNQTTTGQLTATWAIRNRTLEDGVANRWTDASVAGEAGQTTKLVIKDGFLVTQNTISGIAGTSRVLDLATDLAGLTTGYVDFYSTNSFGDSLFFSRRLFSGIS